MPTGGGGHAKTCQEPRSRSRGRSSLVVVAAISAGLFGSRLSALGTRLRLVGSGLVGSLCSMLCSLATPLPFAICLATLTAISLRGCCCRRCCCRCCCLCCCHACAAQATALPASLYLGNVFFVVVVAAAAAFFLPV